MNRTVELRIRGNRYPFRLQVGVATSKAELGALYRQRDLLKRLHTRGDFDVLEAVKAGTLTAAEVERLADEWGVQDYRAHLTLVRPGGVPTLDQHVEAWLATVEKPGTRKVYAQGIRRLLDFEVGGQRLGERPWYDVQRHLVRDAKAALKLAGNTTRTVMAAWSGFYTWAIDRDASEAEAQGRPPLIVENPVRAAKAWAPIETTRHRFLTWEEFERLLAVSSPEMRAHWATLVLSGLRIGELIHLPPGHVHLPTHLHVGPIGGWVPKGYPRYRHGVRDVPLHRALVPVLEQYAERHAGRESFFVNPRTGSRWSVEALRRQFSRDAEAAGLVAGAWTAGPGGMKRKGTGVTPHTCRHTLASWLAQDDVQLMKIAAIIGDTVATVERHYAHLLPRDLGQALNRLGKSGFLPAESTNPNENGGNERRARNTSVSDRALGISGKIAE